MSCPGRHIFGDYKLNSCIENRIYLSLQICCDSDFGHLPLTFKYAALQSLLYQHPLHLNTSSIHQLNTLLYLMQPCQATSYTSPLEYHTPAYVTVAPHRSRFQSMPACPPRCTITSTPFQREYVKVSPDDLSTPEPE